MKKQQNRILGLDIARAVAVVGMTVDHFGPASWATWFTGWPSILFAFLSGMSMALMTSHGLASGVPASQVRRRIAIRGAILLVIGVLLASAGPNMIVVLATLGASFLICTALVTLRGTTLLALGAGGMLVLPQLSYWLRDVLPAAGGGSEGGEIELAVVPRLDHLTSLDGVATALRALLLDGMYPVITWLPVIVLGMGVMTVGVDRARRVVWLVTGLVAALGSAAFTWVMVARFDVQPLIVDLMGMDLRELAEASDISVFAAWRMYGMSMGTTSSPGELLVAGAHSGSTPDLLLNTGISLVVVTLCLWLGDLAGRWLFPLVALGSCAFTVYVGQALVSAGINHWLPDVADEPGVSLVPLACYLGVAVVFCTVWKHFFRRGPLEQAMYTASTWGSGPRAPEKTGTAAPSAHR